MKRRSYKEWTVDLFALCSARGCTTKVWLARGELRAPTAAAARARVMRDVDEFLVAYSTDSAVESWQEAKRYIYHNLSRRSKLLKLFAVAAQSDGYDPEPDHGNHTFGMSGENAVRLKYLGVGPVPRPLPAVRKPVRRKRVHR